MRSSRWFDLLPSGPLVALPSLCGVCRDWGHQRICAACVSRFAQRVPRCRRCALEVPMGIDVCGACLVAVPAHDAACAAVTYGYPWDGLVAGFKFHAALELAAPFVALMEAAWHAAQPTPPSVLPPSVLLPVPLSDARLRERGYNQSWELARRLARRLQTPAEAALLLRIRDTPAQHGLPLVERAANVRRAFALEPQRAAEVRGAHVMLVDDVMTSGSTVGEISRVLRAAGAARVSVCVLARTPRPGDGAAPPAM